MADTETKATESTEQKAEQTEKKPEQNDTKPSDNIQELMNEIARLKRQADKNASEAAEFKKKYRESLSEAEKASMEKAEAEAAREEQFNQLVRENTINKVEKGYLAMGWTADEATAMAKAEVDNDLDAKIKIMAQVDARKKKDYEAEFIASRPELKVGNPNGVTYTKEQFNAMTPTDRTKLFRENKAEYDRLMAL